MPEDRRKFSPRLKPEAVQMVISTDRPMIKARLPWSGNRAFNLLLHRVAPTGFEPALPP
jgi:hypothetical protein